MNTSRFTTLAERTLAIAFAAGCAALIAGCAADEATTGDRDVGTGEAAQTGVGASIGAGDLATSLTSKGFHLARTDQVSYEAGTSTTSEIVCTGAVADGTRSCSELVCAGNADDATRLCFAIVHKNGHFNVTGSADRYAHEDGRVAYVSEDGQRLVGAARRGRHVFTGMLGDADATVTLVVHDLLLDARGVFQLVADVQIDSGATHTKDLAQALAFDTASSWFQGNGLRVVADADLGLLRDLQASLAGAVFRGAGDTFTAEDGVTRASLVEPMARWFLPYHVPSGPGCDATTGVLIDVETYSPQAKSLKATVRYTSNVVHAPKGDVISFGPAASAFPDHQAFVNQTWAQNEVTFSLPNNPYKGIVTTNDLVPTRSEGFQAEYGWPFYVSEFPIHATCVAARVR